MFVRKMSWGQSGGRELGRRVAAVIATGASVAAVAAALGPQASAAGRAGEPQAKAAPASVSIDDAGADTPFSSFLRHPEVAVACYDSVYDPRGPGSSAAGARDAAVSSTPCLIHAEVTVGGWTEHFLKLGSRTLTSGKMSGPSFPPNNPSDQTNQDAFVLRDAVPGLVVRKLRSATLKGLHVDGILLTLSGTVTYPVNFDNQGNSVPLTYKTESFSVQHTVQTPGMNSCWMVANQAPPVGSQLGFADPHGQRCPGY